MTKNDLIKLMDLNEQVGEIKGQIERAAAEKTKWTDIETRRARGEEKQLLSDLARIETALVINSTDVLKAEAESIKTQLEVFKHSPTEARQRLSQASGVLTSLNQKMAEANKGIVSEMVMVHQKQAKPEVDISDLMAFVAYAAYPLWKAGELSSEKWLESLVVDHLLGGEKAIKDEMTNLWQEFETSLQNSLEEAKA